MDAIQFVNQYEITKPLLKSWQHLSQKRSGKHGLWFAFFSKIFAWFFTFSCLIVALVFGAPVFFCFSFLFAVLLVLLIAHPSILAHRKFKQFSLLSGKTTWIQTICFGESLEIKSGNSSSAYSYDQIRFIDENEECFYLWLGAKFFLIVYKNAFSAGNADEFAAFIGEKCSEKEPLWEKRELNKRMSKKVWPRVILWVLLATMMVFLLWPTVFSPNTIERAAKSYWRDEVRLITTVDLPNGAVAFGTDGADGIHAMLLRRSGNRYYHVKAHSYSITDLDEYNREYNRLVESDKNVLAFSYKATIVYGVADAKWWADSVNDADKQKYTAETFRCGDTDFVLYYRQLER